MSHSNIDRLQSPDSGRALSEIGVGIYKDLERSVKANEQVCEIAVDHSRQVGASAFGEV